MTVCSLAYEVAATVQLVLYALDHRSAGAAYPAWDSSAQSLIPRQNIKSAASSCRWMTSHEAAKSPDMNALVCLILLHFFILHRWRRHDCLRLWFAETQRVLHCLEARHYDLAGVMEHPLLAVFREQMRLGRLQPPALRSLLTWMRTLDQGEAKRRHHAYGAALRLGLAAGLGILASHVLEGTWFLRLESNPPILLLIVGDCLILALWLRHLKAHPLTISLALQVNFTQAWLGQSQGGPWHESWISLGERGKLTGRDVRQEQTQLLEDWLLKGSRAQEKHLTWAEELFGLVELGCSVYFLGTACTLPLLKLWSG